MRRAPEPHMRQRGTLSRGVFSRYGKDPERLRSKQRKYGEGQQWLFHLHDRRV